jgi:DNA-binding MarR family transcriptional regulator
MKLQAQTCEDILALLDKIKHVLLELGEERGITRIQISALYGISQTDGLPMNKVADVLHCDRSNVTGLVDRLVSQGLVERCECEKDRRSKILGLTERGQAEVDYMKKILPERLGCGNLSDDEAAQLHNLIQKIL